MKTLELNNLPTPVLLVWGLPEGSINPVASMGYLSAKVPNLANYCHVDTMADPVKLQKWLDTHKDEDDYKQEIWKIPEGEWKLIGKLSELTEEQARELVKQVDWYYNYKHPVQTRRIMFDTALESFHSAIEAEGYFVPSDKPMISDFGNYLNDEGVLSLEGYELYADALKEWQDAQSKTLLGSTLIFKRA